MKRLQFHPDLWARAEPVREAKRSISDDGTLAVDDLADPVRGHANLPRQLGGTNAKYFKLIDEDLAGVNRCAGHNHVPYDDSDNVRQAYISLIVVFDTNILFKLMRPAPDLAVKAWLLGAEFRVIGPPIGDSLGPLPQT